MSFRGRPSRLESPPELERPKRKSPGSVLFRKRFGAMGPVMLFRETPPFQDGAMMEFGG